MIASASCWLRSSRASPSRVHAPSALPWMLACERGSPSTTRGGYLRLLTIQARTCSAAAATRGSLAGTASSAKATNRQCAPVHLRYGSPPKPPSSCCPASNADTHGPAVMAARSGTESSSSRSRRVRCRTAGSSVASNHATAPAVLSSTTAGSQITRAVGCRAGDTDARRHSASGSGSRWWSVNPCGSDISSVSGYRSRGVTRGPSPAQRMEIRPQRSIAP
jgi:hypothetical protein